MLTTLRTNNGILNDTNIDQNVNRKLQLDFMMKQDSYVHQRHSAVFFILLLHFGHERVANLMFFLLLCSLVVLA